MKLDKQIITNNKDILLIIILAALFAWGNASLFFQVPFLIKNERLGFILSFVLFFGYLIVDIIRLKRKYEWWIKPIIDIEFIKHTDYIHGKTTAQLIINNKEKYEITDCYATLESIIEHYLSENVNKQYMTLPSELYQRGRLKWNNTLYSNDKCEITIPPENSTILDLADASQLNNLQFHVCDKNLRPSRFGRSIVCTVKIRIDGKANGKSIKPIIVECLLSNKIVLVPYQFDNVYKGKVPIQTMRFERLITKNNTIEEILKEIKDEQDNLIEQENDK